MCRIFHIRKIYNDNVLLKSELNTIKDRYDRLEYMYKNIKAEKEKYKKQCEQNRSLEIQIEDLKSAISIFSSGEVDEYALKYYIEHNYSLDALIHIKEAQCKRSQENEIEDMKLQPIILDDDIR